MLHKWKRAPDAKYPAQEFLEGDHRRCVHCGAEQHYHREHRWMRQISASWQPKMSRRCRRDDVLNFSTLKTKGIYMKDGSITFRVSTVKNAMDTFDVMMTNQKKMNGLMKSLIKKTTSATSGKIHELDRLINAQAVGFRKWLEQQI